MENAVELARFSGRVQVLNEVTEALKEAILAEWTLREFGAQFAERFCQPALRAGSSPRTTEAQTVGSLTD